MADGRGLKVVFICTGNRARSAIAEALLKKEVGGLATVSSAGLLDLERGPALPEAIRACDRIGLDLSEHISQPLSQNAVADADLVIGFEERHVAEAVVTYGASREKTFLFKELLRLLSQSSPSLGKADRSSADARSRIRLAHEGRSADPGFHPEDEITDPWGKEAQHFGDLVESLQKGIYDLIPLLFGEIDPEFTGRTRQERGDHA